MKNFSRLFKFTELTRSVPQYGYALSGIRPGDMSNLAEHQYCSAVIAWTLIRLLQKSGISIDAFRVMELVIFHDTGEIFGGDIAGPYGRIAPAAKSAAQQFERENQKFFSQFFEDDEQYMLNLFKEVEHPSTLEGIVSDIAENMEAVHFKIYLEKFTPDDLVYAQSIVDKNFTKLHDEKAYTVLKEFLNQWIADIPGKNTRDILTEMYRSS